MATKLFKLYDKANDPMYINIDPENIREISIDGDGDFTVRIVEPGHPKYYTFTLLRKHYKSIDNVKDAIFGSTPSDVDTTYSDIPEIKL